MNSFKNVPFFADKPVCSEDQKFVYGVAHGEIASIDCRVRANPVTDKLKFTWTFNSSSEINYLPASRFTQQGANSQVTIRPLSLKFRRQVRDYF